MNIDYATKIRLVKMLEILRRETDETKPMRTNVLIQRLSECGLECTRQTIYADVKLLNSIGYEIMCIRSTSNEYYIADRSFDMPEIRILLDAVQAASFITPQKTEVLVDKIAALGGPNRAEILKNNIMKYNTTKHTNEDIYYVVNELEQAIIQGKKVSFYYFDYNENKEKIYRKNKKRYVENPYATVFSDDNYYLIAYSDKYKKAVHYRVDRMDNVRLCEEDIVVPEIDIKKHKKELFGMYSGDEVRVRIEADKSLLDVIFDRFGEDTNIKLTDSGKVVFKAEVQLSPRFIAWACSFGDKMKVLSPKRVVDEIISNIDTLRSLYK